jgi:CBS-domain-containing membrane protein
VGRSFYFAIRSQPNPEEQPMNECVGRARIGHWYTRWDSGEIFQVAAYEASSRRLALQTFDGEIAEIDEEIWDELPLGFTEPPEGWTASVAADAGEAEQERTSDVEMSTAELVESLQLLRTAAEERMAAEERIAAEGGEMDAGPGAEGEPGGQPWQTPIGPPFGAHQGAPPSSQPEDSKTGYIMRVQDLMTQQVYSCEPEDALERAAQLMWDHDCGCLPVCIGSDDSKHAVGIITDRDVCMCALHQGKSLGELRVRDAMATQVLSCRPSDALGQAEKVMRQGQIRRLPVLDEQGVLRGMISLADLAREAARESPDKALTRTEIGETLAAICAPAHPAVQAQAA